MDNGEGISQNPERNIVTESVVVVTGVNKDFVCVSDLLLIIVVTLDSNLSKNPVRTLIVVAVSSGHDNVISDKGTYSCKK